MLDTLLRWFESMGSLTDDPIVLAAFAGAAALEYVFPPFPGDTVTLMGGVLVSKFHWNLPLMFLVVSFGAVVGSLVAFKLGQKWQVRRATKAGDDNDKLTRLVTRFQKNGSWYLVLNRFMPGIRPLFFVAAGLSGMSTTRMIVLSSIGAAIWNVALISVGIAVGHNLDQLQQWLKTYSIVAWVAFMVVIIVAVLRMQRRHSAPS